MSKRITIVGAGLVGSLLGTVLAKRGYQVRIFERRPDMRTAAGYAGRSINLAMSDRGLRALETAGLADDIRAIAIPMHGRMMHDKQGVQTYQPYGKEGQFINSVSRGDLNKVLMTAAERHGVEIVLPLNLPLASRSLPRLMCSLVQTVHSVPYAESSKHAIVSIIRSTTSNTVTRNSTFRLTPLVLFSWKRTFCTFGLVIVS
jgi:glycine/D-amino acid oxidase-like deaminating enzyme